MMKILKLAIIIPGIAFYLKHLGNFLSSIGAKSKRLNIKHAQREFNEQLYVADDIRIGQ